MADEKISDTQLPPDTRISDALPILPIRGAVVYPFAISPLTVGRPQSMRAVDDAMRAGRMIAAVTQRVPNAEISPDDLYSMGTACLIHQLTRPEPGLIGIVVQGIERVRLQSILRTDPYLIARVEPVPDRVDDSPEAEARRRAAIELLGRFVALSPEIPDEVSKAAAALPQPRQLAYLIAMAVPLDVPARQEILELDSVDAKLRRLVEVLQREIALRELGERIASETKERLSKQQRDYYLREHLRSIQRELGEEDSDTSDLRRRLDEARLPEEARREAERELTRLASIPAASPEHGMIRTYLDWMTSLPWNTLTGGAIDIPRARVVLDEDHYDLEPIKERILEQLAVAKLLEERRGGEASTDEAATREPILCFVGPPGVGKTSLGQSIARALGRKFVRMSLGGLHDEAEIRGHRRTYIGALPGRIIQGIRRAGARDPVFMLDEIDKVGADFRGDPSSALLEVLDPAQNRAFVDNYLGVSFDLSRVLFLTTANTLDTIPPPLRDRMEIVRLSGYTDEEKICIAAEHLVPRQRAAHGLTADELTIPADTLRAVVRGYTREAGVRNLERQIGAIARKVAREIAEGKRRAALVAADDLEDYLGPPRYQDEIAQRADRRGVATGLAWTPTGGEVLFVEATMMPSSEDRLILTGMLGDVMRESAQAALSYVRSTAEQLGIDPSALDRRAVHIHVPAGAIPKDGPSAGVTMLCALASLVTGRPVRSDVAMTGEITLRGIVMPVGGIREKALAAHRAGLRKIILPRRNARDITEVPEELRRDIEFILVDTAEELLAHALVPPAAAASGGGERAAA